MLSVVAEESENTMPQKNKKAALGVADRKAASVKAQIQHITREGKKQPSNDNKKVGNTFERDLCLSLSGYGFWAHNLAQNSQGQPFDVLAAKDGKPYPIDCKVCEKNIFKMERIEENQALAMMLWRETGNGEGWFALKLNNGEVFFLTFSLLEELSLTKHALSESEIRRYGVTLGKWVSQCES